MSTVLDREQSSAVPAARTAEAAIRTEQLSKKYGSGTLAVDRLDLEVGRGELFGLLGPNGAGKTTTIGMLTTRTSPSGGDAQVGGYSIRRDAVEVKRRIGVVTQSNTLDRRLTTGENLFYHGRYFGMGRGEARRRADEILRLVRLDDRKDAFVDQLSGGMQQRLLIGRALVHSPDVLFLDEPSAGIDPQSRLALWDLLMQLHAGGQTILLTTHYMEEADRLCERVAIMDAGRILALGSPEELKRSLDAQTVVTVQVDDVTQALNEALLAVGGVRRVEPGPRGVQVFAESAVGLLPRVLEAATGSGADVRDLSINTPSLEDVFIRLTGKDLRP